MRKIVVQVFITLDGVMQAPGRPDEDPSNGFPYGGWTAGYFSAADEEAGDFMARHLAPSDLLLGRKTYAMFADYWPKHAQMWPGILDVTKYVASTTMDEQQVAGSGWRNSALLTNIADVKALKETDGTDLKVIGSSVLVQSLFAHDLVDELVLMTYPVVLGTGKKLFTDGATSAAFTLSECVFTSNGVVLAHYQKSGEVRTGIVGE